MNNQEIIKDLLPKIKEKYARYSDFMKKEDLKNIISKYHKSMSQNGNSNNIVYSMMEVENLVRFYLCNKAKEDVDLEILLLDEFTSVFNITARKLGFFEKDIKEKREDILIEAIETYNGQISFYLHLTKLLKQKVKSLNEKQLKPKKQIISLEKNKEDILNKVPPEKKDLNSIIDEYIKNNDINNTPNYLEYVFNALDILNQIKIEDDTFQNFILLKYAFYKEIYFSNNDIAKILNKDIREINKYYMNSLKLLKEFINFYMDQTVEFQRQYLLINSKNLT